MTNPVFNYTVALIKAPSVARGDDEVVFNRLMNEGFVIAAITRGKLCPATIRAFYGAHVDKPYFPDLEWSVTGDVVAMIIHKPFQDTVKAWREVMGPTNPANAPKTTLRGLIGGFRYRGKDAKMADNAVHGSDSWTAARYEASLLFPKEVVDRCDAWVLTMAQLSSDLNNSALNMLTP